MTNIEKALTLSNGIETTVEELDKTLIRGDIGLNDITDIQPAEEDIEVMYEQFMYESRIRNFGHGAKSFY